MRKWALIIAFILLFPSISFSIQVLGVGDSIMVGSYGPPFGPLPNLCSLLGDYTYNNQGASGTCISTGVENLPSLLLTYAPNRVYSNFGINDIHCDIVDGCALCANPSGVSQLIANYETLLSDCDISGAVLYPMQITPCNNYIGYDYSNDIKLYNAEIEEFAYQNNLNITPTYLEMSSRTTDDALGYVQGVDYIHPSAAGNTVYGYLAYYSDIPVNKRDWGNTDYPLFGHESWSWWTITGTGSINGGATDAVTGSKDGGSLYLAESASAVSNVLCVFEGTKLITVNTTTTQGAVDIYIRSTASTNFLKADVNPSWVLYTEPFYTTNQFFQIKITTDGATEAHISTAELDWNNYGSNFKFSGPHVSLNSGAGFKFQ